MASPPLPKPSTPKVNVTVKSSPDEKTLFVRGFFGLLEPHEGSIRFYNQHWKPVSAEGQLRFTEVEYEFVADVRMTPATFKSIMLWMKERVDSYEQTYGEIRLQALTATAQAEALPPPQPSSSEVRRYT